jgi:hypothetical protein
MASTNMNTSKTLCNAIFGKRGSRLEIDMNTAGKRESGGLRRYEIVLGNASRYGKLTPQQKTAVIDVFEKTICSRPGNLWSVSVASALMKHSNGAIVGEIRLQGSKNYRNKMLSGRIYFDVNNDNGLEKLAHAIYLSTNIFKPMNKRPLSWSDAKDKALIKAIVLGLYTRPYMADWIPVDIQEGCHVEASPRCISEIKLKELRFKKEEQEKIKKIRLLEKAYLAKRKEKFLKWACSFIIEAKVQNEKDIAWAKLCEDVPDNWDD